MKILKYFHGYFAVSSGEAASAKLCDRLLLPVDRAVGGGDPRDRAHCRTHRDSNRPHRSRQSASCDGRVRIGALLIVSVLPRVCASHIRTSRLDTRLLIIYLFASQFRRAGTLSILGIAPLLFSPCRHSRRVAVTFSISIRTNSNHEDSLPV